MKMNEKVVGEYVSLVTTWVLQPEELLRGHKGTQSLGVCENVCRTATCEMNALTKQDCAGNTGNVCFWQWIQ